jgi:hypothetical protein
VGGWVRSVAAVLGLLGALGGCGAGVAHRAVIAAAGVGVGQCRSAELTISLGPAISPMTGERGAEYTLTNRSAHRCLLDGRPQVLLERGKRRVPFTIRPGNGNYVSTAGPRPVVLAPGRSAFFLIAKYRCDGQTAAVADRLVVHVAAGRALMVVGQGAAFAYCRPFSANPREDPGNVVEVSAIDASAAAPIG